MNIYTFFKNREQNDDLISGSYLNIWKSCCFRAYQSGMDEKDVQSLLKWVSDSLQDERSLNLSKFQEEFEQRLERKRKSLSVFLCREFSDFPLYLFVYMTCFQVLYTAFETGQWMFNIGPSLFIQMIGVYLVFKFLITYFAMKPKQSSVKFWMIFCMSFVFYMSILYSCQYFDNITWMTCPVWVWTSFTLALFLISLRNHI